jgi:protein-disulfide isomerase
MEESRLARQAYDYYPGKIRLAYHHYANTGASEIIAVALEAAGEQDKFWELHVRFIGDEYLDVARLLEAAEKGGMNPDEFAFDYLFTEAENLNLDMEKFSGAFESERFFEKVRLAKQEAIQAGINYVSLFINGVEYTKYPSTFEDFRQIIDKELAGRGTNKND